SRCKHLRQRSTPTLEHRRPHRNSATVRTVTVAMKLPAREGRHVKGILAAAAGAVLTIAGFLPGASLAQDAGYVGDGKCIACHVDDSRHFSHTRHAKVFRLNPKTERERQGCEACHGPGSKHVANAP